MKRTFAFTCVYIRSEYHEFTYTDVWLSKIEAQLRNFLSFKELLLTRRQHLFVSRIQRY